MANPEHGPSIGGPWTEFAPGAGTALVGPAVLVLVDLPPDSELVASLAGPVLDGAGVDVVLAEVAGRGFHTLPALAIAGPDGDRCRVAVRGEASVAVDLDGGGETVVEGGEVLTWVERVIEDPAALTLRLASSTAEPTCVVDHGVVPAASAARPMDPADAGAGPGEAAGAPAADAAPSVAVGDDAAEAAALDGDPSVAEEPAVEAEVAVDAEEIGRILDELEGEDHGATILPEATSLALGPDDGAGPGVDLSGSGPPAAPLLAGAPPELPPDPIPSAPDPVGAPRAVEPPLPTPPPPSAPPSPSPAADDGYDHLFGATEYRSVEGAAVRADLIEVPGAGAAPEPSPSGGLPTVQQPVVPGAVLPEVPPADLNHDGHTVTLAELQAIAGRAEAPSTLAPSGPGELAVRCERGHLNPPHAHECRDCRGAIHTQTPIRVERPPLGRLRFSTGAVVSVETTLLVGRSPKAAGAVNGTLPELVTVPSPGQDISRTHAEVRVEGWQVFVVDRDSTNGTTITLPGREPQRLRSGEPFPLPPGGRVCLADEVEFTFEVGA